jgi:hypothetical protein
LSTLKSRVAAVAHAEVELVHNPTTSAGVVVGEATGPTSVVAVVAETVDVMAVAMAVEATDAGATHVTDVADHPHIVVETEGIAGVIHEKWKDAKEGASSASKKGHIKAHCPERGGRGGDMRDRPFGGDRRRDDRMRGGYNRDGPSRR